MVYDESSDILGETGKEVVQQKRPRGTGLKAAFHFQRSPVMFGPGPSFDTALAPPQNAQH